MGNDILNGLSTNELEKEIQKFVCEDQRALPLRAKVFAAIAKRQQFDVLPEVVSVEDLDKYVSEGCTELNRGISSTPGIPSNLYAKELIFGAMYPGTLSSYGNGIYFAVPSKVNAKYAPIFPKTSVIALKYTQVGTTSGVLIRAALKDGLKIADSDGLSTYFKENKNRCRRAGIKDLGAFAAALGFDAFYADNVYDDTDERIYTVLNRGALYVQKVGVMVEKSD